MSSLKIDKDTNDLIFETGNLVLITGPEEVEQQIRTNLRTFFREWFLDLRVGVPYFEEFFVKNPNVGRIDAILKDVILNTNGVEELKEFALDYDGTRRAFLVNFLVRSTDGLIRFNEELG